MLTRDSGAGTTVYDPSWRIFECMGHNPAESCPTGFAQISSQNMAYGQDRNSARIVEGGTVTFSCIKASQVKVGQNVSPYTSYTAFVNSMKSAGLNDHDIALLGVGYTAHNNGTLRLFRNNFGVTYDWLKSLGKAGVHETTEPIQAGDVFPGMMPTFTYPSSR